MFALPANVKSLAISGSRHWLPHETPLITVWLTLVIKKLWQDGVAIHIGDNPQGVDALVHQIAKRHNQTVTVWGIDHHPRSNMASRLPYRQIVVPKEHGRIPYAYRDQQMIDAVDHLLCVWNKAQTSKGTLGAFAYATAKRIPAQMALIVQPEGVQITRRNYHVDAS